MRESDRDEARHLWKQKCGIDFKPLKGASRMQAGFCLYRASRYSV